MPDPTCRCGKRIGQRPHQFEEARTAQCNRKTVANKDRVRLLARMVTAANVEDARRDARYHSPQRTEKLFYGLFRSDAGHGLSGIGEGDEHRDVRHARVAAGSVLEPAFLPGSQELFATHVEVVASDLVKNGATFGIGDLVDARLDLSGVVRHTSPSVYNHGRTELEAQGEEEAREARLAPRARGRLRRAHL